MRFEDDEDDWACLSSLRRETWAAVAVAEEESTAEWPVFGLFVCLEFCN